MTSTKEILKLQKSLNRLLKKYEAYLYAEDEYGNEILDICVSKKSCFDIQLFNIDGTIREIK